MFERLFQSHPELSPEMRLDLGTQEIWAGDPVAALRDIDLYLAAHPDDFEALQTRALALSHANRLGESLALYDQLQRRNPGNLDVALDRAQVLSWMGRHEEANASYERILKDHPGDERARMGLAQSLNSSGQHRRAAAMYEEMQRQGSKDPEVAKGLAYARYWSGRPDRAREALNEYLVQRPDDAEGRSLATLLARDQNRGLTVGYSSSEDSDDLRVRRTSLEYRWPVDETTAWSLRGHTGEVDDPGGRLHPFDLGVKHEKTWSDRWSSQVAASAYRPDDGKPAVGIGELNLTHRPNDRFRVDFGLAKEPVVTRKALEDGIRVSILTGGVDWRASERVRLHADQRFYYYNDDNQQSRTSMAARAWMADFSHGRIGVTFGVERLSTNHDLDHGYYDPGLYTEFGPGVEIEKELREGWDLGIKARVGMQKERNAKQEPYHNLDASLEVPLGTLLGFGFEISNSNSNLTSSSGFARTEWAAYLTKGF